MTHHVFPESKHTFLNDDCWSGSVILHLQKCKYYW